VAGLNEIARAGRLRALVEQSLIDYERDLDTAAENIIARMHGPDKPRMIWITGPSCSGKTTTTLKLIQRLYQHGLQFLMLNLDDYFWSLVEHPSDWINDRNYETPEALDIQSVNRHLLQLLAGDTIQKPVYSFKEGRQVATKSIKLGKEQILLLDCLHGLYPPIAENISPSAQFRLYIDTDFGLYENDGSNGKLVRSTDVRLMRRMLRDARHRNYSPLLTILHWHYVRTGELFSILPLRGLADFSIHAGFAFELPALKALLCGPRGLLPQPEEFERYSGFLDAHMRYRKLRELLDSIQELSEAEVCSHDIIPGDAVTREFIGGSTIKIPHNE
jgi:uridine kinase